MGDYTKLIHTIGMTSHLQTNPKDGDAWMQLGWFALKREDFKQAEKAFRNGMKYANSAAAYNGIRQ